MRNSTLVLALVVLLAGCSNQWREADTAVTGDQVMDMMSEAEGVKTDGKSDLAVQQALNLRFEQNASIYFAEAPGTLGPVTSVAALETFAFLPNQNSLTVKNLASMRLFFIDLLHSSGRDNSFVIGVQPTGGKMTYYGYTGKGQVRDGVFEVLLTNAQSKLVLRSTDIDDETLRDVIQLRVFAFDTDGTEVYVGKFSTLVGYL